MERLNKNLMMSPVPVLSEPFRSCYVSIALLNVPSVYTKYFDINQDNVLKSADVGCLIETRLKQNQSSPCICTHQVVSRSDCVYGNSKGGVLIAITDTVQVTNVFHFSFANVFIEASSIKLSLRSCKDLIVTVVYRSSSVPISAFLYAMSDIIV